ncbi:MAG: phage portal protein, partial [Phycisphaerae bacterium]
QVEAKRPNRDAGVFTNLILMLLAMGGGVSRYRLTRDYSGTTYVSARAAHMDDRAAFRPLQGYLGRRLVLPIRREWTRQMAAYGQFRSLSASQYARQKRRWERLTLQPPGWEATDPEKEADSDLALIAAGIETLESVCARRGRNWRQVILQRKREIAFARKHGVELNYDRPSTPGKSRQQEGAEATEEVP